MGETQKASALNNTLKTLCVCNGWSYGVFWRFDQPNSMFLVIEDFYYEDQVKTMIDNMLLHIHMVGEGVIGQAAYSGKQKWIVSDTASGEWDSFRSIEHQLDESEFQCQFSFGIKTIAVIPVESKGVVQLGSTMKIPENMEFLDQTKRSFQTIKHVISTEKSETYDINGLFASLISSDRTENSLVDVSYFGDLSQNYGTKAHVFDDSFDKKSCISTWKSECSTLTSFESQFPYQTSLVEETNSPKASDFTTDALNNCQLDDLSQWFASSSEQNMNEFVNGLGDDVSQLIESTFMDILKEHPSNSVHSSITNTFSNKGHDKPCAVQSAQMNLRDVECQQSGNLLEDIIRPVMTGISSVTSSSLSNCNSELDAKSAASARNCLFSELGLGEILAGMNSCNSVPKSNLEDQSSPTKRRRIERSSMHTNQVDWTRLSGSNESMSLLHCDMEKSNNHLNRKDWFPKSQVGLWIDDSYSITEGSAVLTQPQKSERHAKVIKKRARPGESSRPRPKDRQQIQDRIKELRRMIPNGGKCSIDSLLDRTIKYMLFMQGVTKYADKLKLADEPKPGKDNGKFPKDINTCGGGGGVTRAFEVGSQSMVCPIVVEDLSSPGQMLIEMICEEQGFFLEIADIVRGFGLDILKGEMEIRENKIWAHFIVEVKNGHVTRIDVFWSLVRLLQETSNREMASTNRPSNFIDGGVPLLDNYQKTNFPSPISLAETLS